MKIIKDNWLILIVLLIIIGLIYIGINSKNEESDLQKQLDKIESEKVILKKEIAIKEAEVKKIRLEKIKVATLKNFEIENKDKTIEDLQNSPKIVIKEKIRYKTKIVTKYTPQRQLWNFSLNLHNDFQKYIKLDLSEQIKTDKIIKDLKLVNIKSESKYKLLKDDLNGWHWTYGIGATFGINYYSIGITFSYSRKIKRIK